jgi:hypothetical protein
MAKKKNSKPKEQELIHIRLDYLEAKKGKTDLLSAQMNLLKIIKIINNYKGLRLKELETKNKVNIKLKQINLNIKKLKKLLPIYKIPKILEHTFEERETKEIKEKIRVIPKNTLESQLEEIQNKLRALQE